MSLSAAFRALYGALDEGSGAELLHSASRLLVYSTAEPLPLAYSFARGHTVFSHFYPEICLCFIHVNIT